MNTMKSDAFVKNWKKREKKLKRGVIRSSRVFNTTPSKLFKLLCPTTELDWLPGWQADVLHSDSGYTEYNVVFVTTFFGPKEVWVCTRYEEGRAMEYARTSDTLASKMDIRLAGNNDGTVTGTWVVTLSALNEEGNKAVEGQEEARLHMDRVIDTLVHYVDTGSMASSL